MSVECVGDLLLCLAEGAPQVGGESAGGLRRNTGGNLTAGRVRNSLYGQSNGILNSY